MIKKTIKILLFAFSGLLALILLLIFFAGAGYLNGIIAKQITEQAGKNINGRLSIGSISGSLFSHFVIHDIVLAGDRDTLLKCRSIELEYNPRQLFHKNLDIALLRIEDPVFYLKQGRDSTWNFMKIMNEGKKEADTAKAATAWKIDLHTFTLDNLSAAISAMDTATIPSSVNCDIQLSGFFSSDTMSAEIESMRVNTKKPDFEVANFNAGIRKTGNNINWKNVRLELKNTIALSEGNYNTEDESARAKLEFSPLSFMDFSSFMKGVDIYGQPHISADVSGSPDEYNFILNIKEEGQQIDLSGKLKDLRTVPIYSTVIDVSGLDGAAWTHNNDLKSNISGKLEINGKGFNIKENKIGLKGRFSDLRYGGYSLTGLSLQAEKNSDAVSGSLSTGTFIGDADIGFSLSDVFGNPAYDLHARFKNVDISKIPGIDSLSSGLNGEMILNGRGISPGTLKAEMSMKFNDSEINGQAIMDFGMEASYNKGRYDFRIPAIETPFFRLEAKGHGNIKGQNDIDFDFEPVDMYSLLGSFGMPRASAAGRISGSVSGTMDSLRAKMSISLADILYDSISVANLTADADGLVSGKSYSGNIQLVSDNIRYGSFSVRNAGINAELTRSNVMAELKIDVNDSLSAAFRGEIEGFEDPLIRIKNLTLKYIDSSWESTNDSATVKLDKDAVSISNFGMASGNQGMNIDGRFAFNGNEDLSLAIDNLHLQSLPLDGFLPYDIAGTVSARMSLNGTSREPLIDAGLSADSLSMNEYRIDSLRLLVNYKEDVLSADGSASFGSQEPVKISARIPFRLSLTDSTSMLKDTPGLFASINLDSLDLEEISSLIPVEGLSFSGSANAGAEVSNTINDLVIKGSIGISKGSFSNRQFGVDYHDISLSAVVDSGRLKIGNLAVQSGKGSLEIQGSINLDTRDSLNNKDVTMSLKAKDFQAMKSGTAELNFNSDIGITGSFARPRMKGSLRINSSRLNVDYFTSKTSQVKDAPDLPLLEQALADTVQLDIPADTASAGISGSSLFRDLRGELTLDIPGNTWVTGKDMNFELNGTLRAVKSAPDISLFGDLNVRRGYYKIYGRKFEFNRGAITFTGSTEFNPELDVEIIYRFRDIEKNMRDLKLHITGRLMQPEYAFMLDSEALEEKDAISYIAFGKSINQLGEGEKEKMSGQDIAMGAAVTQLSSVLKGVLQEEAGIDVFEFTGGEDWKSGSVTVGKYITNRLYLSYDRSFDFDKQRKTSVSEKIMLEYQLLRNLLLKITNQDVNSGFDLIWKKNWK
ncbi:MAG TPA: translocation/assembly module TamB domain-containing protein [Bacteroidales bacterium]|nr:translocation/assembly module TamB domain-containing protein [Bacteroidales bacterium]